MNKRIFPWRQIIVLICLVLVTAVMPACQSAPAYPEGNATTQPDWWHDVVFYEVFVRSFYDSDGDGNGDLAGLIAKLDYLNDGDPQTKNDLGVTALWLMPVMQSPSYHGYDAIDYFSVEADYGTNEAFQELISAAHDRGMYVIVDLMLNHTSSEHPWFLDAASGPDAAHYGWYVWRDRDPGDKTPWGTPLWHELDGDYYYGLFWEGMPDLNFTNPAVTAQMQDVARFWLEEMGVDGFRLDAVRHLIEAEQQVSDTEMTHTWLQEFDRFIDGIDPNALTVGEIWAETAAVAPYVEQNEVDLAFEFDLAAAILEGVNTGSPRQLRHHLDVILPSYPPGQFATFLTNHDQNRVMNQVGLAPARARLAATTLLTLPGVPFIYYGEEIGMTGQKPDEQIRTPMQWDSRAHAGFTSGSPWEPANSDFGLVNVAQQTTDPQSLLNHYRELIQLRQAYPALRRGSLTTLETTCNSVFAFLRHYSNANDESAESILVLLNFADKEVTGCELALPASDLAAGTYTMVELMAKTAVGDLIVAEDGRIDPTVLLPALSAQKGYVLLLDEASD